MKKIILILWALLSMSANSEIKCKEDGSTMEMRACFIDELMIEEGKLAKALDNALKSSDWVAREIRRSQNAWIVYRDAHCDAVYSSAGGGSIRFIEYPQCLVELTKQRTKSLSMSFINDTDYKD